MKCRARCPGILCLPHSADASSLARQVLGCDVPRLPTSLSTKSVDKCRARCASDVSSMCLDCGCVVSFLSRQTLECAVPGLPTALSTKSVENCGKPCLPRDMNASFLAPQALRSAIPSLPTRLSTKPVDKPRRDITAPAAVAPVACTAHREHQGQARSRRASASVRARVPASGTATSQAVYSSHSAHSPYR
jgi:hypothetical protein